MKSQSTRLTIIFRPKFRIQGKGVFFLLAYGMIFFQSCHSSKPRFEDLFEVRKADQTGLNFSNTLTPNQQINVFKYMYFYNGGGVGAGDFNNDGKIDLFFAANQLDNKLFLNKGNLQFKDVTTATGILQDHGWSTGVSVVDINNDGLLDIYVCRVGNHESLHSHNLLLVCQGIDKDGVPHYEDKAKEYGLDFSGFSTQAVFFDYDMDGDLDVFLLNHSIHQNGTFGPRDGKLQTFSPLSGDRLYRNNGNLKFTDVTKEAGIHSSIIGYGLGVEAADIDLDGYPDLYVGNDFHENDYLYINRHDGTFKEDLNNRMMHTSQYSMGVDIGDVNNDGFPDIISMDMLASDPYILKRSLGEDDYDIFSLKIGYGYNYQYSRNNLQWNRRDGNFSETGLYSGVAATDWSWAPLWIDFDNDGLKDLFISNGIPKRLNDIDYISHISNQELIQKMRSDSLFDKNTFLGNQFPEIKIPNKFFKNRGDLIFEDMGVEIGGDEPTFSNGAVYADFDGDGDLDVVVNNIDHPALLYENKTNDKVKKPYLEIRLKGPEKNINAIGAKLFLFANGGIRTYEKSPVRGFLSSMETPMHIGLDKTIVDSFFLVWPDNSFEKIELQKGVSRMNLQYRPGLPRFDYRKVTGFWKNPTRPMEDITRSVNLLHKHEENNFPEFERETLIPRMYSTEGPALAVADIDHNGFEDVFIGSSKWKKSAVFMQQASGRFVRMSEPDLDSDSSWENVDACWVDVNNDGNADLIVASGGNEYYGPDEHLSPRIYINDGKGRLKKLEHAIDNVFVNASCVTPCDFNGDGYMDLFIGGRTVPNEYGQIPRSYLLQNDGKGKFSDVTEKYAKELEKIGFVTQAVWADLDKDGNKDLIVSLEWGGIVAFMNHKEGFTKKVLTDKKGWWNFILPVDLDNDGDIDLVVGNLGLNSRLNASDKEPVRLYNYDFEGNGKKEQVLTYYLKGRELPFATKEELEKQMPMMKKKFLYARDFAKATLNELFSKTKLDSAELFSANYFSNAVLVNEGGLQFSLKPLPWQAQLSPFRDGVVVDANHDSLPDILLVGNYYENNVQLGRNDADYGTILLNKGHGHFTAETLNGLSLKGQMRHIRKITIGKKPSLIIARNNDSTMVIRFKDELPVWGHRN